MAKQRTEKIIACIFWVIGAALLITAMLTDFWISNGYLKFGLFEYCAGGACAKFGEMIVLRFDAKTPCDCAM